tara:strand:+ start:62 stop:481 length:420 start_codon:yes stop_codon:yes gene_type:complete
MTGDYDPYGSNPRKYPQNIAEEDVNFTFLLTNDFYAKKVFDNWQKNIIDPVSQRISYDAAYKSDVLIQELNKDNSIVYAVRLIDAFPTAVNSIDLSNENADSVASVTVTMTYKRFVTEEPVRSMINSISDKLSIFKRLI